MTSSTQARHSRQDLAEAILARLDPETVRRAQEEFRSQPLLPYFKIDDLLPAEMASVIYRAFPDPASMRERKTLREHKFVAAQMDRYNPQAEEALFAFHDPRVVSRIGAITGIRELSADGRLYAGGISVMAQGNFLNPHLDNSHDGDRKLYRVLNLLHYVSPDWRLQDGGHLELWPHGVEGEPIRVDNVFNRLVVMSTGPNSWHSVNEVHATAPRCCVSNYYFSPVPIGDRPYFRVTSFRGRPEQPLRDFVLRADTTLRLSLRKLFPKGVAPTSHIYRRPDDDRR